MLIFLRSLRTDKFEFLNERSNFAHIYIYKYIKTIKEMMENVHV
jgi:hypothetical protein